MFTTVSLHDFRDWYAKSESYGNNFTYEGLASLFEYLEELEDSTGEQIEFDPIAIAGEFTEWEDINEYNEQMNTKHGSVTELSEDRTVIDVFIQRLGRHSFITNDSEE